MSDEQEFTEAARVREEETCRNGHQGSKQSRALRGLLDYLAGLKGSSFEAEHCDWLREIVELETYAEERNADHLALIRAAEKKAASEAKAKK